MYTWLMGISLQWNTIQKKKKRENELLKYTTTWIKLIIIIPSERSQTKRVYNIWLRLYKLLEKANSSDTKQISVCLEGGEKQKEEMTTGQEETFRWWIRSLSWLWSWFPGCIHMSELIKLYALNICSLLCVHYTSIKKIKRTQFLNDIDLYSLWSNIRKWKQRTSRHSAG